MADSLSLAGVIGSLVFTNQTESDARGRHRMVRAGRCAYTGFRHRPMLAVGKLTHPCVTYFQTTVKTMLSNQDHKGVVNIRAAVETALRERGVIGAEVQSDESGDSLRVTVTAGGQTQAETFPYMEIEDSGAAIDAPAAHRVRMLVSHFVR
jgi:hypothetical protein